MMGFLRFLAFLFARLLLLTAACFCLAQIGMAQTVKGIYSGSYDGDQVKLVVLDKAGRARTRAYRLLGIDAPEVRGHQPGWQEARDDLREMLFGKIIIIESRGFDTKWKRRLAVVTVAGTDVGLEMVRAGHAWFYAQYAQKLSPEERSNYEHAQQQAQVTGAGVWKATRPIPPWQWRKGKRK